MKMTQRVYILEYKPKHPCHQRGGWIFQHRIVMEKYLGRYLTRDERIHHENGMKTDNRIENLKLFANHSEHLKYHLSDPKLIERLRELGYKRIQTPETKEKCRIVKLGNKHCVGRHLSFETRMKISKANKGKIRTEETLSRMSIAISRAWEEGKYARTN